MKKKDSLLISLLVLFGCLPAVSQELVLGARNFEVTIGPGVFDIMSTAIIAVEKDKTAIYLGEVDFGADGNNYLAAGILFANGWWAEGHAVLHAGQDYESSLPFTRIYIEATKGYGFFETFAENMAYNNNDGVIEGDLTQYVRPTGKQKVWLTYRLGNGNLRAVNFYKKALVPENDYAIGNPDAPYEVPRMARPNQKAGYADVAVALESATSTPITPIGADGPFKDTSLSDLGFWKATNDGLIVDYGEMDFGNGEYEQLIAYVGRDGDFNINLHLEFYLDEVKDENLLVRNWIGVHLKEWETEYPLAVNINKVTGKHRLLVKWTGAINVKKIEFCKGTPWLQNEPCGITIVDQKPSEDAFHCTFVGTLEGQANPWSYEILARGRYESVGNVGFTENGTVLGLYGTNDDGVDFGDGSYKSIVVNHASDKNWLGDLEEANFAFYIDLDPNFSIRPEEFKTNLPEILAGHDPIAKVRIQGTGAWSIKKHTAGEILRKVEGKHSVYMVYNLPGNGAGANVFDIYLDKELISSETASTIDGLSVRGANGSIIIDAQESIKVSAYSLSGGLVLEKDVAAGNTVLDVMPGFYVVKVTDRNGVVSSFKLAL